VGGRHETTGNDDVELTVVFAAIFYFIFHFGFWAWVFIGRAGGYILHQGFGVVRHTQGMCKFTVS
jgi:hypothetical protein